MKKNIRYKKQQGFTLIELLIVVAIIGILSTLLMSNFIGVRQRARDGQRKADISQLQAALEQYRADVGSYPASVAACGAAISNAGVIYMQKIPCDPSGVTFYNSGSYYYYGSGSSYTLTACLENTNDTQGTSTAPTGNPSGCTTNNGSGFYYTASNP